MKIALLTSDHNRHKYMARELSISHDLNIIVSEKKGNENQRRGNTKEETDFLGNHFELVKQAEKKIMGEVLEFPKTKIVYVERGEINSEKIAKEIKNGHVDSIIVFGCGILKSQIIQICPERIINAHQGLSPYYRGSGTNFFPFVNNEIEYVGATIHYINEGIDTGDIISHVRPEITTGDSMYEIGIKTSRDSIKEIVNVLNVMDNGIVLDGIRQWDKGKIYQRKDFNIHSLKKAIENIKEGMIENYIEKLNSGYNFGVRTIKLC